MAIKKEISEFEVTVNDKVGVEILDSAKKLFSEVGGFRFREALSTLNHFVHALIVTKFQQNVAIFTILKEVLVLADMFVLQCSVNLDFRLELWLQAEG